ncbi:MAG: WG repeat-containing protein [Crocinitomicaceae bacterium]
MKYILTLTFVLLAALHSKAQELRIVKDNVNCSYGLKNAKGNWVFEPVYTLIQEYQSGYFLVKDVLGDGLLSPNGSWVIECKYDRLYPIKPTWTINSSYQQERYVHPKNLGFFFMGEIGNQRFLINSKGKQLVKLSPSQTLTFDGDAHFFISEKGPSRTSYFDTTGRVLIDKAEGVIAPFGEFDFSLIGNGSERHSNVVYGNVRLISRNGKYPLSEEFDRAILVNGTRICFDQDLKYGELKTDGTVLIAPEYSRKERLSSSLHIKQNWVIYTESDKVGLMKPDGTILLDTLYDEIRLADRYRDFEPL